MWWHRERPQLKAHSLASLSSQPGSVPHRKGPFPHMSSCANSCPLRGHFSQVHSGGCHSLPSGRRIKKRKLRIGWSGRSDVPGTWNLGRHVPWPHDSLLSILPTVRCCRRVDLGQAEPWPIQTLSMARLMLVGGGWQEGDYFLKKIALVLNLLKGGLSGGGEVGKERRKGP